MDAYTLCPGGCGKKIKFCCGAEVIADLEKIDRMIDGEQRRACIEHIAKMPAKFRDKPCVLAKQMYVELVTADLDGYAATARKLLAANPDNPVALACVAGFEVEAGRAREGVAMLQRALPQVAKANQDIAGVHILGGIFQVARQLLIKGHILAARAHARMVGQWLGARENPGGELITELDRDLSVPLVWKDDAMAPPCADDAPYAEEYEAAEQRADECNWTAALEKFESLAKQHPDDPVLWRAVAAQRACLADDAGAAEAFRKAAALDVPLDDAVEWELYALALTALGREDGDPGDGEGVDMMHVTLPLADYESASARMLTDKRLMRLKGDLSKLAEEDRPPPREAFRLLDRPQLELSAVEGEAGAKLRREDVPNVLGEVLLFGRETDREARIEIECRRTDLEAARTILAEATEQGVGEPTDEKVLGKIGPTHVTLTWRWHWPLGTPSEVESRLTREEFRHRLMEIWPHGKVRDGNGATYAEAARSSDAHLRRMVLAAILDLESNHRQPEDAGLFNELRMKLGLPAAVDVEPFRVDLENVSLLRLSRLPALLMPDEQLLMAFNLAASVRATMAMARLGDAVIERSSIENDRKALVCLSMARSGADARRTIAYLQQGREFAVAAGKSPASWLLEELVVQLSHPQKPKEIEQLIDRITSHRQEPGVMEQLTRLLIAFGIVDPAALYEPAPSESAFSVGGLELKAQVGGPTTGQAVAAAATEEKKSGLWLPGMD